MIYSIYNWRCITISLYNLLLGIGLSLAGIDSEDNMAPEVVHFVTKAAIDRVIRAKNVMMNMVEQYRSAIPVLNLQGNVVAMAYYQSVG